MDATKSVSRAQSLAGLGEAGTSGLDDSKDDKGIIIFQNFANGYKAKV
jgi:hypothetical protein